MKLLITGGTGTIGKEIINLSLVDGIDVNVLTRNRNLKSKREGLKYFYWNPDQKFINDECFDGIDTIINLSGFNVFNFWTKKNKLRILYSRVKSTEFILDEIYKRKIKLKSFISASGIQAYKNSYSKNYTENDSESDESSFLNKVVINWESKVLEYEKLMPSTSFSIMRVGLVLSNEGGLYKVSNNLARFYLLSPIGNGNQWQSWIHVNDAARAFIRCSKESWKGIYNLVTLNPVTQKIMDSTSFSIMRVGLVLSNEGGLYKVSNNLARFYLLSPIGNAINGNHGFMLMMLQELLLDAQKKTGKESIT